MSDFPFASLESFQQAYINGLSALLHKGGLGPFILVCANASFDRRVHVATFKDLQAQYEVLRDEYVEALTQGKQLEVVEEDLLVFLKLHAVGFDKLQQTETRYAGPWEVQFNQLRSFRPRRISAQVPQHLHVPFDETGFHFNKPFMLKEAFWGGDLNGLHTTLYYNKYPFVDYHGLLVPEREKNHPQFLSEKMHHYMWQVTLELSRIMPGVGFGYNSLGAFASVNHLHFQMFIKPEGLPVMHRDWQHNGGNAPYPAVCETFYTAQDAWHFLQDMHRNDQPYNVIYADNTVYVLPRRKQGTYPQPGWSSGFAWLEMAGGMISFNRDSYLHLDQEAIVRELKKLGV